MIQRMLVNAINRGMGKRKVILLFGARQVGKTTLLDSFASSKNEKILFLNGDEPDVRTMLNNKTSTELRTLIGDHTILVIDEAQRIPNIGLTVKLMVDQIKDVQVIATGSSSFEMANHMNEPLTGRKYEYTMYPLAFKELVDHHGLLEELRQVENRLIYGSYPDVVTHPAEKEQLLKLIADSYLFKDILMLDTLKRPKLLEKILTALAFQIGSEVSFNELSRLVGADKGTVEKYIQLFEQTFILFQIPSYSRNIRNELKKSKKYYFYDCGIRNALLGNFNSLDSRTDVGALWENYLISERRKKLSYDQISTTSYFWRTTQQQEVDLIEQDSNGLKAFEFKWREKKNVRFPKTFTGAYPEADLKIISKENYQEFLL